MSKRMFKKLSGAGCKTPIKAPLILTVALMALTFAPLSGVAQLFASKPSQSDSTVSSRRLPKVTGRAAIRSPRVRRVRKVRRVFRRSFESATATKSSAAPSKSKGTATKSLRRAPQTQKGATSTVGSRTQKPAKIRTVRPQRSPKRRVVRQKMRTVVKKSVTAESPWSGLYMGIGSIVHRDLVDSTGTFTGVNLVGVSYRLSNGVKLALKPTFLIKYNLDESSSEAVMGNTILEAAKKNVFVFNNGIGLSLKGRFYLPTGEAWRDSGTNGMIYLQGKLVKSFGRWGFAYILQPRYYLQSQRASTEFDDFGRLLAQPKALASFRLLNAAAVGYKLLDQLQLKQILGVENQFKYSDPEIGVSGESGAHLEIKTQLAWDALPGRFDMELEVAQSHALADGGYSFYNGDETTYSLAMAVYF